MTTAGSDATAHVSSNAIFDALGDELHDRRQPELTAALVAAGGLAVGIGLVGIGFVKLTDEGSKGLLFAMAALTIALVYGALAAWPWGDPTEVRPGAIAALSVALLGLVAGITDLEGAAVPFLLVALFFGLAWLAPFTRGRPWLLGMALIGIVGAILSQVGSGDSDLIDFGIGNLSDLGAVALVLGILLLGAMFVLDKQGRHGALATPFAAVGNATFLIGLLSVIAELGSTAGIATLALLGGIFLVVTGVNGDHRRFTTWHGAIAVFIGLAGWVAAIYDGDNETIAGLLFAVLGIVLIAAALLLGRRTSSTDTGPSIDPIDLSVDSGMAAATPATPVAASPEASMTETAILSTPGSPEDAADASPAAATPAAWYPDPMSRFEDRYWDGDEWTSLVRRDGVESTDPI